MRVRAETAVLLAVVAGCLGQPERTFFDDSDAGSETGAADASTQADATATADTTTEVEASPDTSVAPNEGGMDGGVLDAPADVAAEGPSDAGLDAPPDVVLRLDAATEAGCGPTNVPQNCGACGTACDTTHSLGPTCATGTTCAYGGCVGGWADCHDAAPNTDGCETQLGTIANCGGCAQGCDTAHSTGTACDGSACSYAGCARGFADCTTAPPNNDGCETAITTAAHCGDCDAACDTTHSVDAGCPAGTACTYAGCATGWSNCNTTAPDLAGCECNTPACCGTTCQTTHATGIPSLSYYDCNALANARETTAQLVSQALEACAAYTGSVSQCASGLDCSSAGLPEAGPYVCNGQGGRGTTCTTCWSYGANGSDFLQTEDCNCPGTPIGTWN